MPNSNLLQNEFAQSGEDVVFNVLCKDFFNNSRTCLMSVSEANQMIQVQRGCSQCTKSSDICALLSVGGLHAYSTYFAVRMLEHQKAFSSFEHSHCTIK